MTGTPLLALLKLRHLKDYVPSDRMQSEVFSATQEIFLQNKFSFNLEFRIDFQSSENPGNR